MQTNHHSHFLLVSEVWPLLEKAAAMRGEARVVNHSSDARKMCGALEVGCLAKREAWTPKVASTYGGNQLGWIFPFTGPRWARYGQTKLLNVAFTYALADRCAKAKLPIKVLVAHPGLAATHLQVTTLRLHPSRVPGGCCAYSSGRAQWLLSGHQRCLRWNGTSLLEAPHAQRLAVG